jgi:hypothetical protein
VAILACTLDRHVSSIDFMLYDSYGVVSSCFVRLRVDTEKNGSHGSHVKHNMIHMVLFYVLRLILKPTIHMFWISLPMLISFSSIVFLLYDSYGVGSSCLITLQVDIEKNAWVAW